uniref:hypothetical protein n=1 Tax=Sphingomonas bacterium TaxID=1895847 RepID=UPI00260D46BE|nr:hypothetical protein [Sphingomonas bacterium]
MIQVIVTLYSFIFFFVIAYGYFFLFTNMSYAAGLVAAVICPSLAWFLAKWVGSSETGIKGNLPVFCLLLLVSASGVYNSAMLYWEGERVVTDVIGESEDRYEVLEAQAIQGRTDSGVVRKVDEISALKESLFSEIRNPLNCGQGQEAQRIIGDLQRLLPGFQPLSSKGVNCGHNEAVIEDYRSKIDALVAKAPWNNADYTTVIEGSKSAKSELDRLNSQMSTSYSPSGLREIRSILEGLETRYRDYRHKLARQMNVDKLPASLDISQVKNLGDATKLPALFLERTNQISTYIYLGLAGGFDYLMVHLFALARRNRVRRAMMTNTLAGAW